jgi:hypothetical protein
MRIDEKRERRKNFIIERERKKKNIKEKKEELEKKEAEKEKKKMTDTQKEGKGTDGSKLTRINSKMKSENEGVTIKKLTNKLTTLLTIKNCVNAFKKKTSEDQPPDPTAMINKPSTIQVNPKVEDQHPEEANDQVDTEVLTQKEDIDVNFEPQQLFLTQNRLNIISAVSDIPAEDGITASRNPRLSQKVKKSGFYFILFFFLCMYVYV